MDTNTKQTFLDYLATNGPEEIAIALGVPLVQIEGWKNGLPAGEKMIRLAFFLNEKSLTVQEVISLPEELQKLGRLIFKNVVSVDDLVNRHHLFSQRDSLIDIFHRPHKTGPRKLTEIARLCEELQDESKTLCDEKITTKTQSEHTLPNKVIVAQFANLAEAMLPIGKIIINDLSPEDRYSLRILLKGDLAELADIVNALTSERARETKIERQNRMQHRKGNQ